MDYTKIPMSILITRLAAECDPTDRVALMNEIDRRIPIPRPLPSMWDATIDEGREKCSPWRPIKTAPTGVRVLIALPNAVAIAKTGAHDAAWWDEYGIPFRTQPSHWMPLPEVPR